MRKLPCGRRVQGSGVGQGPQVRTSSKNFDRSSQNGLIARARERLEEYLRARGLRFTQPRWAVAEAVLRSGQHQDSRAILADVKKRSPSVGEATVYRTIRLLCDAGILQETLHSSEGRPVFELAEQDHHDHIVCGDCGEVFEFQSDALERLQSQIAKRLQFGISAHRHVLVGRCEWKNRQENQSR